MLGLLVLPVEILHNIFVHCEAADLGPLSCSCHHLNNYIQGDHLLWKAVYLNLFVRPFKCYYLIESIAHH